MQGIALATSGVALGPPSTWLIYLGSFENQMFSALVLERFPESKKMCMIQLGTKPMDIMNLIYLMIATYLAILAWPNPKVEF